MKTSQKNKNSIGFLLSLKPISETVKMARLMREIGSENGSFGLAGGDIYLLFWAALVTLSIISTIIFSCSDGMSKERNSTADVELYGGGCAAGCGAGCGA